MLGQVRLGALCWLMSVQFFVAQFAAQSLYPEHNLFLHDISMLGITTCGVHFWPTSGSSDIQCSPLHVVFNTGIVLHGVLTILGAWLTRSLWPSSLPMSAALLLLALGGVGAMVVGLVPLDYELALHSHGAVTAIAAPGIAFLIMAGVCWASSPTFARWTALTGLVIVLAGLCYSMGIVPFGRGAMERLAVWPQTMWFVGTGAAILIGQQRAAERPKAAIAPALWPLRTGETHGLRLR
ncbi:DUF998 domain-containing protein [Devosia sediminis]|uniref:DUF998 domain-containing protein n=1 Tax=Devosia sediminis TaxID=2798801 RepID=A0A934IP77_9HYPH|nr:DUF998 domain-containing protein [Devosia sediminis]MBJ3784329.1 DUF998 domain-containing protein [Devosia sediminis]